MTSLPSAISAQNLAALVDLAELAPGGDIVEVGVFQGGSAIRLYDVCLRQGRTLHLFDSFKGMPVFTPELDVFKLGSFNVPRDTVNKLAALMPSAKFYPGIYPATHPKDLANVAFVHVDCDQYLSYRSVIDNLWPLVVPGGMMLFDDYPYLAGAKKAVEETFTERELVKFGEHFYVKKPAASAVAVANAAAVGDAVAVASPEPPHG